jgi:GNAT superfamily N-acetyltransferase
VLAWVNERPVDFILNGARTIEGKRIAWNGGKGVVPGYRRNGIGRRMMEACLAVYRAHDIDNAYLEAIAQKTRRQSRCFNKSDTVSVIVYRVVVYVFLKKKEPMALCSCHNHRSFVNISHLLLSIPLTFFSSPVL